jgi:hypothetical protein
MEWEGVGWICLAQDKDRRWAGYFEHCKYLRVPQNIANLLNSPAAVSFWRIQLHGFFLKCDKLDQNIFLLEIEGKNPRKFLFVPLITIWHMSCVLQILCANSSLIWVLNNSSAWVFDILHFNWILFAYLLNSLFQYSGIIIVTNCIIRIYIYIYI